MKTLSTVIALAAAFTASQAAKTAMLVPLYVAPLSTDFQAALDAASAHPSVHFYFIINPNSGPQNTSTPGNPGSCNLWGTDGYTRHGCNKDWTTYLGKLNALPNAQAIGYVRTAYGNQTARSLAEIQGDILELAQWDTDVTWAGTQANISIAGLFFDETAPTLSSAPEYRQIITYANNTFASTGPKRAQYSVVMNPGSNVDQNYESTLFGMASAVVTRETCWTTTQSADCSGNYVPFNVNTLSAGSGLPYNSAFNPQAAVLVHQFIGPPTANVATLNSQVAGIHSLGLHSAYFTSGDWHTTTTSPATIGAVADALVAANGS